MSSTVSGGKLAAITNKKLYGKDFYKRIGRLGGSTPCTKPSGFAAMSRERVSEIGRKGGRISRRGKAIINMLLFRRINVKGR